MKALPLRRRGRAAAIAGALLALGVLPRPSPRPLTADDVQTSADAADATLQRPPGAARRRPADPRGARAGDRQGLDRRGREPAGRASTSGTSRASRSSPARCKAGEIRKLGTTRRRRPRQRGGEPPTGRPLGDPDPGVSKATEHRRRAQARSPRRRSTTRAGRTATTTASRTPTSPPTRSSTCSTRARTASRQRVEEGLHGRGHHGRRARRRHRLRPSRPARTRGRSAPTAGPRPTTRTARCSGSCCPEDIDAGLSWYVFTELHTDLVKRGNVVQRHLRHDARARRATSPRPPARSTHDLHASRPGGRSRARCASASHPDDYLLQPTASAPAILVTDPNTAGVYDTVYVDLDGDHDFADEKPVTKASPASYRDIERRRLHRPVGRPPLLHLRRHGRRAGAGRPEEIFGDRRSPRRSGEHPGLDGRLRPGHRGPRHADREQRRRPGRHQRPAADVRRPARRRPPSGRGRRRRAGREARAVRRHLLRLRDLDAARLHPRLSRRRRRHVELLRRRPTSTTTASTRRARRRTSGTTRSATGARRSSPPATARRASARRRRRSPATGMSVGASTQFGGTGWDSIKNYSQVVGQRRDRVVEPRPGRDRRAAASTSWPTAPTRPATRR